MIKYGKSLTIVILAAAMFFVAPIISNNTTAHAKTFYFKYGKVWVNTSKVKYRGKKKFGKKKFNSYDVYMSKTDLKDSATMGTILLGGIVGKWYGVMLNLVGTAYHPKHGIRTRIIWIPRKMNVITSMSRWH